MAKSEITPRNKDYIPSVGYKDYRAKPSEVGQNTQAKLQDACVLADQILLKKYLPNMHQYEIVPVQSADLKKPFSDSARLFKLNRIIYDKEENNQEKLLNVYNALYSCGGSVILMLCSDGQSVDFYIGTKSPLKTSITTCKDVLKKALEGNFPGTEISGVLREDEFSELMKNTVPIDAKNSNRSIAAVTSMAGFRDGHTMRSGDFVQGLEKLVDSMRGEQYTLVIIADPVQPEVMEARRIGYESLYNHLLPFAATEMSFGQNESAAVTNSITQGVSSSITNSVALTTSSSHSIMNSHSHTEGSSDTKGKSDTAGISLNGMIGEALTSAVTGSVGASGGAAGAAIGGFLGGPPGALIGSAIGKSLSMGLAKTAATTMSKSFSAGLSASHTESNSHTDSSSDTDTDGTTDTDTKGRTVTTGTTKTKSEAKGTSDTKTFGSSINYTTHLENRYVKTLLHRIDLQLERIDECMDVGMWDCAAYVITGDAQTGRMISSTYQALIRGKESGTEASAITIWQDKEESIKIAAYLQHFNHPLLKLMDNVTIMPTTVLSGEELTVAAGLPQQSLPGMSVDTFARFGREISRRGHEGGNVAPQLNLGQIYHMGRVEKEFKAFLDMNTLTAHTFITGSTGGGKSNTIYRLLEELRRKKVPWLVIEPAKGEYKDAFGGLPDVEVYGTNPFKVPHLLKINPFSFPKDIHVLEHIDRLVEIFNACWPMYAAMPAILRESIERAYEECGWNLNQSQGVGAFPDFSTLLDILPAVIDSSSYSADTTSDYKGALVTRIRSLTRGIHGMVFSGDLSADALFNHNAIIDLSRVGSQETKSLIMGTLVLKLQEYRMSENVEPNMSLRHITVLEEAHNLLKKTSSEQSQESSNLAGQAVVMLSNAIAEMRTYGEGFVIADQSPGLMDMSVVRNTNTKIIMRLPDAGDRELVGRAAGLNDAQIEELASLEKGVAAIYQSDWLEPVLAKVAKFESAQPLKARYKSESFEWHDEEPIAIRKFLNTVLDIEREEFSVEELEILRKWYKKLGLSIKAQYVFESALSGDTLDENAQTLVILSVAGQRVAATPSKDKMMQEIKRIFRGRYEIGADDDIIRETRCLIMDCLPEILERDREGGSVL